MAERISFLLGTFRRMQIGIPSEAPTTTGDLALEEIVEFDASLSEIHELEAELTEHPIEFGSPIADHYKVLPQKITINGIVSDSPLPADHLGGLISSAQGVVATVNRVTGFSRVDEAYDSLRKKMNNASLVNVVTTLRTYEDMAITSLSVERDAPNGNILNSTISLREVKRVLVVLASERRDAVKDANVNKGATAKTPATTGEVNEAGLFRGIADTFIGLFGG